MSSVNATRLKGRGGRVCAPNLQNGILGYGLRELQYVSKWDQSNLVCYVEANYSTMHFSMLLMSAEIAFAVHVRI